MKRAGSREVKQHWSEYVRRVSRGETVVVTRRGKPVFKMVPIEPAKETDELEELAQRFEAEGRSVTRPKHRGEARRRNLNKVLDELAAEGPVLSPGAAQSLLADEREERF
jgi:prevent-host-death family protein